MLMELSLVVSAWIVPQGPPSEFVFHVYADPVFGDDDLAFRLNPGNPNDLDPDLTQPVPNSGASGSRALPLDQRSDFGPAVDPTSIAGFLQHAPFSFRTLSGNKGAIEYVQRVFSTAATATTPAITQLPWTHPSGRVVTHVVIHCLPGLYGPRNPLLAAGTEEIDPVTGLPWNGEILPIRLGHREQFDACPAYDRISIQGTSALDTIFDARGNDPSMPAAYRPRLVLQVLGRRSGCGPVGGTDHGQAFLDGITIRGARSWSSTPPASRTPEGSGICLSGNQAPIGIRITNCIITQNTVGIVLDAEAEQPPQGSYTAGAHTPLIVNNTIVGNDMGIWAGNLTVPANPPSLPYANTHAPAIVNNIIDPDTSGGLPLVPVSCFEGIFPGSVVVATAGGQPAGLDFNAWNPSAANQGLLPNGTNWVGAELGMPVPVPTLPAPRVDTRAFFHLYVRDLLRNQTGTDVSPHDLRISPFVSTTLGVPPGNHNPLVTSPLIATGINVAPVAMAIGTVIPVEGPGLPPGVDRVAITGWDYDCEGMGNPRIQSRWPVIDPPPPFGVIDIGADQCGDLIIAGYLDSTRMFQAFHPVTGSPLNSLVFFVNMPAASAPAGFPRPWSNWLLGGLPWYGNVQTGRLSTPCLPPVSGNPPLTYFTCGYSDASGVTDRWIMSMDMVPFMRNLACDFSPHLLRDVHPAWTALCDTLLQSSGPPDPYAANPWYSSWWPPATYPRYPDNPSLFFNDDPSLQVHAQGQPAGQRNIYEAFGGTRTAVASAHLNPPGTATPASGILRWITGGASQFGPISPCSGSSYTCGNWCLNDQPNGCPDPVPALGLDYALRINCEIPSVLMQVGRNSNLQTFLVLPNSFTAPLAGASAPESPSPMLQLATRLLIPPCLGSEADHRALVTMLEECWR